MKILIYVGYSNVALGIDTWSREGADGMVYTWQKLATVFAKNHHDVVISGQVEEGADSSIRLIATENLKAGHYDVVIGVAYIHFLLELESRGISWDRGIFWVHYATFYPWHRGKELEAGGQSLLHHRNLHHVVASSEYHARQFASINPSASELMRVVPLALDPADRISLEAADKIPGRFIYSSAARKGLKQLLGLWPRVRSIVNNASLVIATPDYAVSDIDGLDIDQPGIIVCGQLSGQDLYREISQAQYFMYPCQVDEPFSLTALEMMNGNVSIISTDAGNLAALLDGRAKLVDSGLGPEQQGEALLEALQQLEENPQERLQLVQAATDFAKDQTWDHRYSEWMNLITADLTPRRKNSELYGYFEDKTAWRERFLTYAARTREWELVVDEPFENCFSFPLFTPEFCRLVREEAEFANRWTTDRHHSYPTTDIVLEVIGLGNVYREILNDYVVPMAREKWVLGPGWKRFSAETFLAKYTPDAQGHLALHHDESDITCLIQLSDLDEYVGGGTYFSRQKVLLKNAIGYATVHPGNITHRHGGRAISEGLRYILVSFIKRIKK